MASTLLWGRLFLGPLGSVRVHGRSRGPEGTLILSAPRGPRNPHLLKERIRPVERQTHTRVNLISGSLGF